MHFNAIKSIISICLLLLLNACGIGRYHSLNLVRPDKNMTNALVKPKHKTNKVTKVISIDSAIAQINEEDGLAETTNTVSEKKETLIVPFLKKSSTSTKKGKIGLKEKMVLSLLNSKIERPIGNHDLYESIKKQIDPKRSLIGAFEKAVLIIIGILTLLIGIVFLVVKFGGGINSGGLDFLFFIIVISFWILVPILIVALFINFIIKIFR
jgi:hypothetical protein